MARVCCLEAVSAEDVQVLGAALEGAGEAATTIVTHLEVPALKRIAPDVLVADLDRCDSDPLEKLRQLRFVLPNCVIVVYTANMQPSWGRDCHLAGASCLLSKESHQLQLQSGLRQAMKSGCFTDVHFSVNGLKGAV